MKVKALTLIASAAAMSLASAFTIDFNSLTAPDGADLTGATVSEGSPLVVTVPGYGQVSFQVAGPDILEVDNTYTNSGGTIQNSLELDLGETVVVTFLGPEALGVNFDIIGISASESSNLAATKPGEEYQVSISGTGGDNGGGIAALNWTAVPEPSSSLLVLVGAGSLILRRRR